MMAENGVFLLSATVANYWLINNEQQIKLNFKGMFLIMNDTVLQRDRYFRTHNESRKSLLKFDKFI
jgi:hypothetical protein